MFGGISSERLVSSGVIEVGHGFINIVYSILYDYSGAFIGFVDDYVCILQSLLSALFCLRERLGWILTLQGRLLSSIFMCSSAFSK